MPAFILGTGRCGSTLLHEIVAMHPDVAFVTNAEDRLPRLAPVRRGLENLYRGMAPVWARRSPPRLAPSEAYRILDREVGRIMSEPQRDLVASDATPWLAKRLRDFVQQRAAGRAFVHKFTGWPRARLLKEVFPEARFVHVVRDGRAVASSWMRMPWWRGHLGPESWHWGPLPEPYAQEWERSGRSFVVLAGLAWKLLLDAFEEARSELPQDSWIDVRYEDLVADPAATVARTGRFLGLGPSGRFDRRLERFTFVREREPAFARDLDAASLRQLEGSLGAHLERWGYGDGT